MKNLSCFESWMLPWPYNFSPNLLAPEFGLLGPSHSKQASLITANLNRLLKLSSKQPQSPLLKSGEGAEAS